MYYLSFHCCNKIPDKGHTQTKEMLIFSPESETSSRISASLVIWVPDEEDTA